MPIIKSYLHCATGTVIAVYDTPGKVEIKGCVPVESLLVHHEEPFNPIMANKAFRLAAELGVDHLGRITAWGKWQQSPLLEFHMGWEQESGLLISEPQTNVIRGYIRPTRHGVVLMFDHRPYLCLTQGDAQDLAQLLFTKEANIC